MTLASDADEPIDLQQGEVLEEEKISPSKVQSGHNKLWLAFSCLSIISITSLGFLCVMYTTLSDIHVSVKNTEVVLSEQQEALKRLDAHLDQAVDTIDQKIATESKNMDDQRQQVAGLAQSIRQDLQTVTKAVDQLQHQLLSFKSGVNQPDLSDPHITKAYSIFGVESYGVVLQDDNGNFEIAQIGKELSIGVISSITADAVHVGNWIIIPKIRLDQVHAIDASPLPATESSVTVMNSADDKGVVK